MVNHASLCSLLVMIVIKNTGLSSGIGKLSTADGKALTDPEVLRKLTSSVSCALDEAAQALHRMRAEQQGQLTGAEGYIFATTCSLLEQFIFYHCLQLYLINKTMNTLMIVSMKHKLHS